MSPKLKYRDCCIYKVAHRPNGSTINSCLRFETLEDRCLLATIPVSLNGDAAIPVDTDGGITLREAIAYVNGDPVPAGDQGLFDFANLGTDDTITFSTEAAHGLDGGTILLTAGELSITESVTINASMLTGGLTIDARHPTGGLRTKNISSRCSPALAA